MNKENSKLAIVPQLTAFKLALSGDCAINKDDILAISVSAFEQEQEAVIEHIKAAIQLLNKESADLGKELQTEIDAVTAKDAKPLHKILRPLEKFGMKVKANVCSARLDCDNKKVLYTFSVGNLAQEQSSYDDRRNSCAITQYRSVEVTALIVENVKRQAEISQEIGELNESGAQARFKLSKLPGMERAARAKIATTILEKTEDGRAFLASFLGK